MLRIGDFSKLAKISIKTLRYYDKIGLLHPSGYTDAGYRLYNDADLERLQHILLFRELEFPLKEIKQIMDSPSFDPTEALEQQIGRTDITAEERLAALRELKAVAEPPRTGRFRQQPDLLMC